MSETPAERSRHARKANLARQAKEPSGAAMTAAARAAAEDRFIRQAQEENPGASPADIARIANAKRELWKESFVAAGVAARKAKAAARAAAEQATAAARQARSAARGAEQAADAVTQAVRDIAV